MSKEFLSFTSNDVEITDIKPVYRGFFTMNQYQFKHKCFNGEWSDTVTREIFERGQKEIKVEGPIKEVAEDILEIHRRYW